MTVLHAVALLDAVRGGGLVERTLHLARAMRRAGARCAILGLDVGVDVDRRRAFDGITLHLLPTLNRRFLLPASWRARIAAAVSTADVVEITGHWTVLNALVYRAVRAAGTPYIVRPAGALEIVGRSGMLKQAYNAMVGKRIVRDAAAYVAVTEGELPGFRTYGVPVHRVTVIPNGVDVPTWPPPDSASFRERHGLRDRHMILFVGRLSHIKGPDLLLDAFAAVAHRIPDYDLVFAGPDDGLLAPLLESASARGVSSRVHFLGYLGAIDKAYAYAACDFLALPSRREAMSLVALEAAAHGKPVLLTDQCGFAAVETCGGGRVVTADAVSIAEGLVAMAADQPRLAVMGRTLRDYVATHYTWDLAAGAFLHLCGTIKRCPDGAGSP